MALGLLGAFGAALCYGVASILQALAARQTASTEGLDPRLLLRLLGSWRYLLGLGLDGFAFLLSLAALRTLPLFVVQAVVASFLAVTAVLGALVLHMPLRRADKAGLVAVVAGLVLVGLAAAEDKAVAADDAERWGVLVAAVALGLLAVPLGRLTGSVGAGVLGGVAGLAFGVTAVGGRILPDTLDVESLLTDPTTYGLVVAAIVALLTYSTALQRGTVTQATAPLVIAETIGPAIVGLMLLGDEPRPGWGWVSTLGFVLAVLGALSLARHGDLEQAQQERTPEVRGAA